MIRCATCGTRIKPWFEFCYECYTPSEINSANVAAPIVAKDFMKSMRIDGWR